MTRTFNNASFDLIDLSTPSPVVQWWRDLEDAWEAEQDYETEADILAEAHFDTWLHRQDEAGLLDLSVYA